PSVGPSFARGAYGEGRRLPPPNRTEGTFGRFPFPHRRCLRQRRLRRQGGTFPVGEPAVRSGKVPAPEAPSAARGDLPRRGTCGSVGERRLPKVPPVRRGRYLRRPNRTARGAFGEGGCARFP